MISITKFFRSPIGILTGVLIALLVLQASGVNLSIYSGGWELNANIVGISNSEPYGHYKEIWGPDGYGPPYQKWVVESGVTKTDPVANYRIDFDNASFGYPDVGASISNVRENNGTTRPYEPLQSDFNQFRFKVDYHEYLFDIAVRTYADVQIDNTKRPFGVAGNFWVHETSMPFDYATSMGKGGDLVGKNVKGSVYVKFNVQPWDIHFDNLEGYSFNGYWVGVMSANVESAYSYAKSELRVDYGGWSRTLDVNSRLTTYYDDGSFTSQSPTITWDPQKILNPSIPSNVIVEIPYDLMAGAFENYDSWAFAMQGNIAELKPIDYETIFTVRMESFVVKEYEQRDPGLSPHQSGLEPTTDFVQSGRYGSGDLMQNPIFWIIIALIVLTIITALGFFIGLPMLLIFAQPVYLCKTAQKSVKPFKLGMDGVLFLP